MKIKLIIATILIVSFSNCKRYSNNENSKEFAPEKTSISKKEVQEVMNLKVNLTNYGEVGKYNIAIPSHYYAQTTAYQKGDIDLKFGKLSSENKNEIFVVELESSLSNDRSLANEEISIVKEDNSNLITINDIKNDIITDANGFEMPIYYQDENSIIYDKDIKTITFSYDIALKSYVIYQSEIDHFVKISEADKLNLAIHLLKNGKNLLNKNVKSEQFLTWQDYVNNFPKAEIEAVKNQYVNVSKEVKVFLNTNERSNIDNQSYFLYHSNSAMKLAYLNFIDAVKSNNIINFDLTDDIHDNFENIFLDYDAEFKYNLQQFEYVDYFKIDDDYDSDKEKLICHFDYQNEDFYIVNYKIDNVNKNFYITMLNYFAKHKTLETLIKI